MKYLLSVARRLAMPLTLAACGMIGLQAQTAKLPVQLGVASYNIRTVRAPMVNSTTIAWLNSWNAGSLMSSPCRRSTA